MTKSNPGWIKIHRSLLTWEWWDDANAVKLFIYLLLTANREPQRWNGIVIERGQKVIGRKKLAEDLKMSERQIRTLLTHLKTTNEVTIKVTSKFSIITICNYEKYQSQETNETTSKVTSKRPTNDQQTTTIQEYKNIRIIEKENTKVFSKKKNFVKPNIEEIKVYCLKRNNSVNAQKFFDYYESKGWLVGKSPMKDWMAAIRTWEQNNLSPPCGPPLRSRSLYITSSK